MVDSCQRYTSANGTIPLPKDPHSAINCGYAGCEKTVSILDLLESQCKDFFMHIVILRPTVKYNKVYQARQWIWTNPEVYIIYPGERLHDWLQALYGIFRGESTLYINDDCLARALSKKRDMLSELA